MPRRRTASYEQRLSDMVADAIAADSEKMAAESGPPPGRRMSEAEEARLWGLRDPNVDHAALLARLLTEGLGEEAQMLAVVQEIPDLAAAYAEPVQDAGAAEALATLAEYPFRATLWAHLGDPEDRVAVAERAARAWEKTHSTSSGQALPQPIVEESATLDAPLPAQPAAAMGQPPTAPAAPAAYPPASGQQGV